MYPYLVRYRRGGPGRDLTKNEGRVVIAAEDFEHATEIAHNEKPQGAVILSIEMLTDTEIVSE